MARKRHSLLRKPKRRVRSVVRTSPYGWEVWINNHGGWQWTRFKHLPSLADVSKELVETVRRVASGRYKIIRDPNTRTVRRILFVNEEDVVLLRMCHHTAIFKIFRLTPPL